MRVNVGRTKSALILSAIALLVTGVLLAAATWPLREYGDPAGTTAPVAISGAQGDVPPLESFAPAWSLDLRRPLTDTPAATQPVGAPEMFAVRLVGTILDPARPRGIFITMLGQMEMKGVGEKTGGAEILQISERGATLSVAGRPVVLKVEKYEVPVPPTEPVRPPTARSASGPAGDSLR